MKGNSGMQTDIITMPQLRVLAQICKHHPKTQLQFNVKAATDCFLSLVINIL